MAQRAKTKQKPRFSKKKIVLVVLGVLVLSFGGYFAVRAYIHHRQTEATYKVDKVRFAATEKDMDAAYAAIVKTAGKPYQTGKTHVCSYGALKFARGPLSCGIAYQMIYGIEDMESGKSLTGTIYAIFNGNYGFTQGSYRVPDQLSQAQTRFSAALNNPYGYECELNYEIWSKANFNSFVAEADGYKHYEGTSPNLAVYSFGCNHYVPKALYPIDKSTE